ncbi:anion exchange protein 3-like isoform X2 [Hemitrygon akajei]|uniref:anion exchange protein 3-like isoform X2 n=1 Tax=Hemitrygon akajei TaxID=2704970 RepID=UPI003BF9D710
MATNGSKELANVPTCSHTAEDEAEKSAAEADEEAEEEEEEEEELDKLLAVECLRDLLSDRPPQEPERTYSEKDFEYHRRTSLHIHHPLSSRLPLHMCFRRKVLHSERKRKKKRKKKKTSVPPSEETPTIQEVDEEEDEEVSEVEVQDKELSASEEAHDPPQFLITSRDSMESLLMEEQILQPCEPLSESTSMLAESCMGPSPDSPDISPNGHGKRKSVHRVAGAQRTSYNLQERVCIGSMTSLGTAVYQKVPTDEAEAQMLATVDLDDMKSHRFEDNPGVRRHLVKKPSRGQMSKKGSKMPVPSVKKIQQDRKPHEVFVELNELVVDKNNEMTWQETARWIKFEEDVESETDRWGKPHVASLTFRSLLELRKTIAQGAVLLDLEQKTLPGIAHLVVETMVITDQIKAEDRTNVLKALLVKHSHPNDEKEGSFFPRSGNSNMSSVLTGYQVHQEDNLFKDPFVTVPLMGEEHDKTQDPKNMEADTQKNLKRPLHNSEKHKTKSEMKLLRQIPENAEATVVLIGTLAFLEQPTMAFVRLSESVLLESVLEVSVPVRFIFVLLGPAQSSMDYHEIGRSISTLMSDKDFHEAAYMADDRQDLLNAINEFLDCSIVIPPLELECKDLLRSVTAFQKEMLRKRKAREHKKLLKKEESLLDIKEVCEAVKEEEVEDDPLKRTNRLFGGLIRDIRRRYPKYLSDVRDAFNCQCLAAVIFIYFAALSPAITFGGLLGTKTEGLIGVSELIVSTSAMGIFFSLFGAQPLLVIGFTGPLLVFEEAFYNFSKNRNIDYLTGRVWIGFWLMFIVLIAVAFEGSLLVRYISPFTQEVFAFLISAIFIYETLKNLSMVFSEHPLLKTYPPNTETKANYTKDMMVQMQPNTALLSLVLMVSTFFIAYFLRKFRNSRFLGGSVRRVIGDFGIPIAILLVLIVDISVTDTYTEKLNVPLHFSVTSPSKRSWFIHPLGKDNSFPLWMIFGSVIPALLLFILIFMETNITTLIVSKKERRLVKGSGFHLDLLLIGMGGGVCGIFGLPWQTAATVRSIAHVNALTVMSKSTAPGEKIKIKEVKEQRITGMLVALLVGLSVVMGTVLRMIPMAVLFGIFLYMGLTSLTGTQLYERLLLMFIPAKFHPDHVYVTKVRTWRMHLFTSIQIVCIIILWVIKCTIISLAFPFFLILTVPTRRYLLPKIFQERELLAVHPEHGSLEFLQTSSSLEQIATEAAKLSLYNKRRTITSQEIYCAFCRIPGQ